MNDEIKFNLTALNEHLSSMGENGVFNSTGPRFVSAPYDVLNSIAMLSVDSAPNFWNESARCDSQWSSDENLIESFKAAINDLKEECSIPYYEVFKNTMGLIEKIDNENIETIQRIGDSVHALRTLIANINKLSQGRTVVYERINGTPASLHPDQGLCDNCFSGLSGYGVAMMFQKWEHYSGVETYPVGGRAEYYCKKNLYSNPKRLQLAKFCLQQLTNELNNYTVITYPRGN